MKNLMLQKHRGVLAFEYIIVLVLMAVAAFIAWDILGDAVTDAAGRIADFIGNNGQAALG